MVEGGAEIGCRQRRDCGEQVVREFAADHGADLDDLLDRGEAIEPGHEGVT